MKDKSKYYKEVIKSRMYKSAAAIWGVRNIDNFDPVLKLMVESLASEINKLSNEMNNMEARLLERLAGTLTPDIYLSVRPAHLILHAKPLEEQAHVSKTSTFQYKTKESKLFNFTPAGDFRLINGEICSLICGGICYRMDNRNSKEIKARSIGRSEKLNDNLWIGLRIQPSVTGIKNLSFYFDLPNIEKRNEMLNLLPYSRWELDGKRLSILPGIYRVPGTNVNYFPLSGYDVSTLSDESILNHYNHRFITVKDEIINRKENYRILPDELTDLFPNIHADEAPEPLLWLKITLPPGFENYILEDFFVSINAFPVINRKYYAKSARTNPLVSVFRFETDENEYFLSIEHVSDSKGRRYIPLPNQSDDNKGDYGTYILKRGGIERFDSRNAKEFLSNLVDLLREENSSFAMYGKGFVDEIVKKIDEEIGTIELKMKSVHTDRDIMSYMVIDTNEIGENVYVDYWITNCESANGIKAGSFPAEIGSSLMAADSLITLTQSYGGKQRRDLTSDMYKYALTGKNSIYTQQDIINFCYAQFGDRIISASVTKGIRVSPRPKEGLIRSIDVHVTLREERGRNVSSRQDVEDRLLSLLKQHSPEMYQYSVFISHSNQDIQ